MRADKELAERISKKYSIKNVTGLNLRPLIAYDDPFDIIAHAMVGSEGTLAFLSEVTMKTLHDYKYKASAMVYFLTMKESCEAVVAMKKLKAGEEDLKMSAENLMVKSAEMLETILDCISAVIALRNGPDAFFETLVIEIMAVLRERILEEQDDLTIDPVIFKEGCDNKSIARVIAFTADNADRTFPVHLFENGLACPFHQFFGRDKVFYGPLIARPHYFC